MSPGRCSKRKASDALVLAQIDGQNGVGDGDFGYRLAYGGRIVGVAELIVLQRDRRSWWEV